MARSLIITEIPSLKKAVTHAYGTLEIMDIVLKYIIIFCKMLKEF